MKKTIDGKTSKMLVNDGKIGLVATRDEDGWPHLSFLSSLQGLGEDKMTFGVFCDGLSKQFIKLRPNVSFLVLNAQYEWLRGRATYTHTEKTGEVFDSYNSKPLFRYNSYFGFHTIYFMDLEGITEIQKLKMGAIVFGAILTRLAAPASAKSDNDALNYIGRELFSGLANLKFISWYGHDGMARIVPIVEASAAGSDRVVFVPLAYKNELNDIPVGTKTTVFCMNLKMESVLVKGTYIGKKGAAHRVEIERVYNSMPPKNGYIYPRSEQIPAVTEF